MASKYLFLDFEFRNNNEQAYDVVCCCVLLRDENGDQTEEKYWLYREPVLIQAFKNRMQDLHDEGYIFTAWVASAELRSLLSLEFPIDPLSVIDVQVEYKLWANTDDYFNKIIDANHAIQRQSRLEGVRRKMIIGKYSLDTAYAVIFNKAYDEKNDMRRLILENIEYTPEEQTKILDYCMKDTVLTYQIFAYVTRFMVRRYPELRGNYLRQALRRGEYVKGTTWVEWHGYPIDQVILEKVGQNIDVIEKSFVTEECQDIQDLYIRNITKKNETYEVFAFNNAQLKQTIERLELGAQWPTTKSGMYATDMETLEKLASVHPFVKALLSVKRKMSCIKYLTVEEKKDVLAKRKLRTSISSLGRIHCYVNPFGTTTGRNAPPASTFVFAQSSWQRVLVRPRTGRAIIGLDYRAQEILIAGIVSKDPIILKGYASGDPYITFALEAGLIDPVDAGLPIEELKKKYAQLRNEVLKPVVLGMNYGLGKAKLSTYLSKPQAETDQYYFAHKQVYHAYWENVAEFIQTMERSGQFYQLGEDWGVYEAAKYGTLVNWRIQAWGAAVLRAVTIEFAKEKYRNRNINIITLLHDAIYLEVDEPEAEEISAEVSELMIKIFHDLLPSVVRIDVESKIHREGEFWIEDKAKKTWEIIKPFIVD